ncbi:MAG TPA: PKD domain-containing protein [Verrucomicrobiae bacterium]|nr:PKD domain-containing protein [Verrucomicrobiae bacterium]
MGIPLLTFGSGAYAAELQVLRHHVPRAVVDLKLQAVSRLPDTNRLDLAIGLPLRNPKALNELLAQIYDPSSPNYHHYLTPEQFTERFGPSRHDYQALIAFAKSSGFRVTATHPNRILLDVNAPVSTIETALHVTLHVYRHPTEARTFYAPDAEPSLALAVPVLDISGLDNYVLPHPTSLHSCPVPQRAKALPTAGSGPGGTFLGSDFRAAYIPGVSLTGSGQTVGLLEFDGYYASDITSYETQANLPSVTLTNVLLDGTRGHPGSNDGEVSLDIEMAVAMAPDLSKVIVYEAGSHGIPNDILSRMVTDNLAQQLSSSWTWSGGVSGTTDQLFQEMAAQGQSFFQSSGDSGAYSGSISAVDYPADDPYITVVGGTTLTTTKPGGSWVSETVWNWMPSQAYASSGGISTSYPIPGWQQGTSMSANRGSTTMRNIPDVALTADNIYVTYNNGQTGDFGGTSCAAPLWAAFVALVNQQAASNGFPAVGFVNPAVYSIGNSSNYAKSFHDVVTGNNTNSSSPAGFFAAAGYDLCTGWGTPTGQGLINALINPTADLVLAGAGSPNPVPAGLDLTYTLTVTNHGPAAEVGVVITDALPATVTFTSATASQGTCTNVAGVVTCSLGAIASNATATVAINVIPNVPGLVTNTAVVSGLIRDAGTANNTSVIVTTIQNPPPFIVRPASIDFGTLLTSQTATQSISVINTSASTLTGSFVFASGGTSFGIAGGNSLNISAGTTGIVLASFSPVVAGIFSNSLVFATNDGAVTNPVIGSALAPAKIGITPSSQAFGLITVGSTVQAGFVITNSGGVTLTGSATISAAGFSVASGSTFTISPSSSSNVVINFTPTSAKSFSGNMIFTSNGGSSTNAVSGTGVTGPAAHFSATPTSGSSPLVVTFTDTSTGTITNRVWNLGDGTVITTTATTLLHTYTCGGPYTVSLTVRGTGGSNTSTQTSLITVADTTPPVITTCAPSRAASANAVGQATVPDFTTSVQATDNCTTSTALMRTQSPPAGTVVSVGVTRVLITVTDVSGNSSSCTTTFTVQAPPPFAQFTASPRSGLAPLVVTFDNSSTGLITSVLWVFGDGATSSATSPTHTYTNAATFSVTLTAQSPAGTNSLTRTGYITAVQALPPIITSAPAITNALLQYGNHAAILVDATNFFAVTATDPQSLPLGYQWQFGDNVTNDFSPSPSAVHIYGTNCGPYTTSVTVSNGYASTATNLGIAVVCELPVQRLQLKSNFAKANNDSATLSAVPDLDVGFEPRGQLLVVDVGDAMIPFTLNKDGFGVNAPNTARLHFNKRTGAWILNVRLHRGNWRSYWAAYGLTDAAIVTPGVTVTVPIVVLLGQQGFAADHSLNYTAATHQTGQAK